MNAQSTTQIAYYFGLSVEVVQIMEHCSLIRFDGRESIVDTLDLVIIYYFERAA
jgi:hypothetical protein